MGEITINDGVILYSTGCPRCTVLKKKLNDKEIGYTQIDSIETMRSLGIMEVPVLSVNGEMLDFSKAIQWVNKQ